jgi:hypothetical protein
MAKLLPQSREAVQRNVKAAPPLTERQRGNLRLLFQSTRTAESEAL